MAATLLAFVKKTWKTIWYVAYDSTDVTESGDCVSKEIELLCHLRRGGKRDAFSYSALAPLRRRGSRYFGACNNAARTDGVMDFRSDISVALISVGYAVCSGAAARSNRDSVPGVFAGSDCVPFCSSAVARARAAQSYLSLVLASFNVEALIGGDAAEQHRIAAR
jgi:hypothetical protein